MSDSIKSNIRTLADQLKDGYEFNKDKGQVTFTDVEKKVKEWLPEDGIDFKALQQAQETMIDITAAATLATGEIGQKELKGNKTLDKVTSTSKYAYSKVDSTFWREQSGTAMGKPWRKVGKAVGDLTVGVGRKSTPYKDVVRHLAETSESIFSN